MERRISPAEIGKMSRIKRINFTNTVSGIKGACLIGTIGHRGTTNLAMFNSLVHISGGDPQLLGFFIRPLTVPRHTYHNIKAKEYFTINLVHEDILHKAHQTSANYPENVSEFEAAGLTPQFTETHPAPYVLESRIKIGLQFAEEHFIRANDTILIVGKVAEILLPEEAVGPEGHVDPADYGTIAVSGLDTYYRLERLKRLGYARPGEQRGH